MTFYFLPDAGKVVDTVTVNGAKLASPGNSYTFPSVKADSGIEVTFKEKAETDPEPPTTYHEVTATSSNGGTISPKGTTQVVSGGQMLYTILPDEGYELTQLLIDGTPVSNFTGTTYRFTAVTSDAKIHAEFKEKSPIPDPTARHTVTASVSAAGGGKISPAGATMVPNNGAQTFYFTPDATYKVESLTIGGNGGGTAGADTITFPYSGLSYTLTGINADTSIEVTFASDPSGGSKPEQKMHTVTTKVEGEGGTVSPSGESRVADGGSLLLTFTPDPGYVLKAVKKGNDDITSSVKSDGSYRLTDVTGAVTVTASFEKRIDGKEYRVIKASAEAGGTIAPSGELRVAKGGVQSFTIVPEEGKVLDTLTLTYQDSVSGTVSQNVADKVSNNVFVFDEPYDLESDCTLVATFKTDESGTEPPKPPATQQIVASATSGGSISPAGSMMVAQGSKVLFTFTPDFGYELTSVLVNDTPVDAEAIKNNVYMHTVTDDATVRAAFQRTSENPIPNYYQVTASVDKGSGTISPSGVTRVKAGTSQTFTFLPDKDFTLESVMVDGKPVLTENFTYTLLDIAKDTRITASFRAKADTDPVPPAVATIVSSASTGGSISPVGTMKAAAGSTPSFTMTPDAGYHIDSVEITKPGQTGAAETTTVSANALVGGTYRFAPVEGDASYAIKANFAANPVKPVDPSYYRAFAQVIPDAKGEAHGTITPSGESKVAAGASQTFSFIPDSDYVVDKVWVKNTEITPETDPSFTVSGNTYTLFGMNSDMHIVVKFKEQGGANPPDTTTIKARATAGGSIEPEGDVTVVQGAPQTFTFTAFEGYELYQIKLDGATTKPASELPGNYYTYTNTSDGAGTHSIEAMYKLKGTDPGNPDDPDTPVETVVITASAGQNGTISPSGSIKVAKGGTQPFIFHPTNSNYVVDQVLVNDNPVTVEGNQYTFTNVQEAATIDVSFKEVETPVTTYTVTASASSGGSISPSGSIAVQQAAGGEAPSIPFTLKADNGYELKQLLVGGADVSGAVVESDSGTLSYTLADISEDTTVRAEFKTTEITPPIPTYTVVHVIAGSGGTVSPSGDVQVPLGSDRTFTITPHSGYGVASATVDGVTDVTDDAKKNGYVEIVNITEETTLEVTFEKTQDPTPPPAPPQYTITASATTGGVISPHGATQVIEGHDSTFLLKPDSGYVLSKFEVDGTAVEATDLSYTFKNVKMNHTIKATFEKKALPPVDPTFVTLHASAGAGGAISPNGDSRVPFGSTQTFTFVPDAGKVIDTVTVDGKPVTVSGFSYTLFNIKADTSINVTFKQGSAEKPTYYTLSAQAGGGGEISPAGDTAVVKGGSLLYSFAPHKGYQVASVKVDDVDVTATIKGSTYRFENVNTDHSIAVTFQKVSEPPVQQNWKITATSGDNGSISPAGDMQIADGGTQTFYFTPNSNYKVTSVTVNGVSSAFSGTSYTLFNVKADTSISVAFTYVGGSTPPAEDKVTVNATAGVNGSISPVGETEVTKGGQLLLSFIPEAGYTTDTVTVDDKIVQHGGTSYRLTSIMNNTKVTVTFKKASEPEPTPIFYPVTTKVMPTTTGAVGGTVSPSGTVSVPAAGSKTFYAYPSTGYTLEKVLVGGTPLAIKPCVDSKAAPQSLVHRADAPLSTAYSFTVENVTAEKTVEVYFTETDEGDKPVEVPVYAVTASASTGGMISPSGQTTVPKGHTIDFALKADADYTLVSLTKLTGDPAAGGTPEDVTEHIQNGIYTATITDTTALYATYEAVPVDPEPSSYVTVSATAQGPGAISPQGDTRVKYGESQTFTFIPQEGSALKEVTVDGSPVVALNSTYTLYDLTEDTVIVATFEESQGPVIPPETYYNLSARAGVGGTVWPSGLTTVVAGASLLYTCLPDEGYEVTSVFDTLDDGTAIDITESLSDNTFRITNVNEDHTLQVTFRPTKVDPPAPAYYTVSATSGANGTISPSGDTKVNAGSSKAFTFIPASGYVVDQVRVDGVAVANPGNPYTLYDINADTRINVTFKQGATPPITLYTIDASVENGANGHGTVSPAGKTSVIAGQSATFDFFPEPGYVVDKVMVDDTAVPVIGNSYVFSSVDKDHALVVSFRSADEPPTKSFTITPKAGPGGSIDPAGPVSVDEGGSQRFTFSPQNGYAISSIKVDGVNIGYVSSSYTFTNVTEPHSIEVTFAELVSYTLSARAGAGGSVTPSGSVYAAQGSNQTFVFEPEEGYAVSALTIDGVRTETSQRTYTFTNIQTDHTLLVEFAQGETVTVTASAGEHGSIDPAGAVEVVKGDQRTFTFTPDKGYRVDTVMVDAKIVQIGGTSYTMTDVRKDSTISVSFVGIPAADPDAPLVEVNVEVKVLQDSNSGGSVSPSGSLTMLTNSTQRFYAFPEEGHTLESVTVNGVPTQFFGLTKEKAAAARDDENLSRQTRALIERADGTYGGFWFEVTDPEDGTRIEVAFRPLLAGEAQPEPVDAHTVKVAASSGGMISPEGELMVPERESLSLTYQAYDGYHLKALEVNGVDVLSGAEPRNAALRAGVGNPMRGMHTLTDITTDTEVFVSFEADPPAQQFTITSSVDGAHGSISPFGATHYVQGASAEYTFTPDPGYQVEAIVIDGTRIEGNRPTYLFENIQAAHTISVSFKTQVTPGPVNPLDTIIKSLTRTGDKPLFVWAILAAIIAGALAVAIVLFRRPRNATAQGSSDAARRGNGSHSGSGPHRRTSRSGRSDLNKR